MSIDLYINLFFTKSKALYTNVKIEKATFFGLPLRLLLHADPHFRPVVGCTCGVPDQDLIFKTSCGREIGCELLPGGFFFLAHSPRNECFVAKVFIDVLFTISLSWVICAVPLTEGCLPVLSNNYCLFNRKRLSVDVD